MENLRNQISNFMMHEETPVETVIGNHSIKEVITEIESILKNEDSEAISHTLGFVRDAALYQHPHRDTFREELRSSTVWEQLEKLLRSSNFYLRGNTIYTIAKFAEKSKAYLLLEAFPYYFQHDPIHLPSLLFELLWLSHEWNWDLLNQIVTADNYLQRWSLCQVIDDRGDTLEVVKKFLQLLELLKRDAHPLIAAEAQWRFERITVKLGSKLSKPEWRQEVKRIAKLEPKLTFEKAAMQFMQSRQNYTIEEFDGFLVSSTENSWSIDRK